MEQQNQEKNGKNVPERTIRAGAIAATVWQNIVVKDGREATYRTVSLTRSYKDKNDQWQHTTSLRANDLPRAALVLNKAYEFVALSRMGDD